MTDTKNLSPLFKIIKTVWDNKKVLMIFNGSVIFLSIIILLLLSNQYKSVTMISIEDDSNLMAVPALLEDLPFNFGGGRGDINAKIIALTYSRSLLDSLISKFRLDSLYESKYVEDLYETVSEHITIIDNEDGTLTISYYEENPEYAQTINRELLNQIVKLDIYVNIKKAGKYREFIVKRSEEASQKLAIYEDSLLIFSEKTGLVSLSDQIRLNVEGLAELEMQKIELEIQRDIIKFNTTRNNSKFSQMEAQIGVIKEKIYSLKNESEYSNIPITDIPSFSLQYLRLYRNVKIQEEILNFLVPLVENAKLEEKKKYSSILIVDEPSLPEKKFKPRRSLILILIAAISALSSIIAVRIREIILMNKDQLTAILK